MKHVLKKDCYQNIQRNADVAEEMLGNISESHHTRTHLQEETVSR